MSAHLDSEERVKELIKDSFEKNTVEFPIFLDKLIDNELADSRISEQRLINDIEKSLGNQKSKVNATETTEKLNLQRSRSRSGSRSRSRSGLSKKSSSAEPSSVSPTISSSSSQSLLASKKQLQTFQNSSKFSVISPSISTQSTANEPLSKSSIVPSPISMNDPKIERKVSPGGTAMSMDEIAKILNQREATRKPDSTRSSLEATKKVDLEVSEKYQIKNPDLNDLIQFDRTDLPDDVGLFLQSKSPDFDEAEMLTELQAGTQNLIFDESKDFR